MEITFIGHNAMYFGRGAGLLVDPVLLKRYGDNYTSSPVEIYPPRTVHFERMPPPAGIIISHEHSDHFQIPALAKLDRSIPIYVGPLMPQRIVDLLTSIGFSVRRSEIVECGDVIFQLYPAGGDTALWESRVSQIYVRDKDDPEMGGCYVTVDALTSEHFISDITAGLIPTPTLFGCSNNAQVTPSGVYGSTDNILEIDQYEGVGQRSAFPGIEILSELFSAVLDEETLSSTHLLITGGGFLKDYEDMGPFPLSDQKPLASSMQLLLTDRVVLGPDPGDIIDMTQGTAEIIGTSNWVELDQARYNEPKSRRDSFISRGGIIGMKAIKKSLDRKSIEQNTRIIESDLALFSRILLTGEKSAELVRAGAASGRNDDLILFRLINEGQCFDWQFSLKEGSFIAYSEQVRPDLATKLIERRALVYAT